LCVSSFILSSRSANSVRNRAYFATDTRRIASDCERHRHAVGAGARMAALACSARRRGRTPCGQPVKCERRDRRWPFSGKHGSMHQHLQPLEVLKLRKREPVELRPAQLRHTDLPSARAAAARPVHVAWRCTLRPSGAAQSDVGMRPCDGGTA
jgi:hypothetical protein